MDEVRDPWYIKRIEEIQTNPVKYKSWRIDDGLIYKQRHDPILGPVTGEDDTWKLVIPVEPVELMGGRVIERPWAVVASDLMEFPQSKGQYKYVVVFQDLFTRWVELRPLRTATGKNCS